MNKYKKISIIIPAYKPDDKLLSTIQSLIDAGFSDIVVVNDGSGCEYDDIFKSVEQNSACTLLVHDINRGKGAALKTAFAFIIRHRSDFAGVVTADADGQHIAKDICACADAMLEKNEVILGCRDFSLSEIPARSKFGNRATSVVFRIFVGLKLSDTQTGLRAIPYKYLSTLSTADGNRYEYETSMLFMIKRMAIPYSEVGIETVYIEENRSSHFRVIRDSIRIYGLILKYVLSSLSSSITDILVYLLLSFLLAGRCSAFVSTVVAATVARVASSVLNYLLNAKVVFHGRTDAKTLLRYYTLAVPILLISMFSVYLIDDVLFGEHLPMLSALIKIAVDTILFLVSFRVQHAWVFREQDNSAVKSKEK